MIISLIGMSGCGKTYWARQLEQIGFIRYSCDDCIEQSLQKELQILGLRGINDMSTWLGQPYEARYSRNSARYLRLEKKCMLKIFDLISSSRNRNIVIDTTGSVIYMPDKILEKLYQLSRVIYLSTPQKYIQKMIRLYFNDPKPVIWNELFHKRADEDYTNALRRCYPMLLKYRSMRYSKHALLTINSSILKTPSFTTSDFLNLIQNNQKIFDN